MGKNAGLLCRNEMYLAEFVELWNALVIDPTIWNVTDPTAAISLAIANGHRVCQFVCGAPPQVSTIGTIAGFNVAPSPALYGFADQGNRADNLVKNLVVEFLIGNITLIVPGTILIGLNDANGGALGGDALYFEFDGVDGASTNIRIGGVTTSNAFLPGASGKFKIEIKRNRVNFYQGDVVIGGNSVGLPNDFMYFWAYGTSGLPAGTAVFDLYPIYNRYELI